MSKNIYLFSTSSHPDAISVHSLDITLLSPNIDFSKYDYLILTSKQASKSLKQYERQEYIKLPALCISTQTASSFTDIGGEVLHVGSGYGDNLLKEIHSFAKTTKWLYLRAEKIASDFVEKAIKDGFNIEQSMVYTSQCSKQMMNLDIEISSTLIFTSPSSVQCFLKYNKITNKNIVVVIGQTTGDALPLDIKYKIAKEKTINSCLETIKVNI